MKKYTVAISRQFGSLGRPIARELSEILGIEYYDRDIVDMVSKKHNISVKEISDLSGGNRHPVWLYEIPFGTRDYFGTGQNIYGTGQYHQRVGRQRKLYYSRKVRRQYTGRQ